MSDSTSSSTSLSTSESTSPSPSPPPPPPPSSDSESSTSSSVTPSSSSSESSAEPSSSSSTPSSTSSTPSLTTAPPEVTPSTTRSISTGPNVVTRTSIITSRSSGLPAATSEAAEGKGFFQNTGAVAGVFSVVGLIGLAILIALVTNTIRRRRAKRFDREIAEAAREAAAAQPPAGFLDDEDDYNRGYSNSSGGGGGGGSAGGYGSGPYSDVSSHGTFSQPAMGHNESYGMREIGSGPVPAPAPGPGPAPGEVFDYAAAGAAGIGVARARSMRDGGSYGQALQEGGSPYAAFAAPTQPQHQQHPYSRDYNSRPNELDILEAAGMGAHVSGAGASLARGPSQYHQQHQPNGSYDQGYASDLNRTKSITSQEGAASQYSGVPSTTASQYYNSRSDGYGPYPAMPAPTQQQQQGYATQSHQRQQSMADDDDDAYGGYVVSEDPRQPQQQQGVVSPVSANSANQALPNPFDRPETTYSDIDDEPRRVLKIANE